MYLFRVHICGMPQYEDRWLYLVVDLKPRMNDVDQF